MHIIVISIIFIVVVAIVMVIITVIENKNLILNYKEKSVAFLQVSRELEVGVPGFQLLVYTQLCIFFQGFCQPKFELGQYQLLWF